MRLSVDPDLCECHGQCEAVAPRLFRLEDGAEAVTVLLAEVPPDLEEAARMALGTCPVAAISLDG